MTLAPYFDRDGIRIYNADCLDHLHMLEGGGLVLVTDPPYGIAWKRSLNKARNSASHAGIQNDHDTSARDRVLHAMAGSPAVVFGSFYAPFPTDLKQVLVWGKPPNAGVVGSTTGFRRDSEPVFLCGTWPKRTVRWSSLLPAGARGIAATTTATGHPHTKPVPLMRVLVERCPAGVVVDPFMGSGSTLVACAELGRRAIGFEIDESYCQRAAERVSQALAKGQGMFPGIAA